MKLTPINRITLKTCPEAGTKESINGDATTFNGEPGTVTEIPELMNVT
jgi:hypothetical protein